MKVTKIFPRREKYLKAGPPKKFANKAMWYLNCLNPATLNSLLKERCKNYSALQAPYLGLIKNSTPLPSLDRE